MRAVVAVLLLVTAVYAGLWGLLQDRQAAPDFHGMPQSVSYSPFEGTGHPDTDNIPTVEKIRADLKQLATVTKAIRLYSSTGGVELVPPIAAEFGLKVMVGLSAEQYAGYLADRKDAPDLERVVRDKVAAVAGHPAILCYALGNEIQPPLARWLGRRTIERYLERLYQAVKDEDPGGLVSPARDRKSIAKDGACSCRPIQFSGPD